MSLASQVALGFARVAQEFKTVRTEIAALAPSGSFVDGGAPSTDHTGNLRVDFGSVT